jgi:phosphatidylserine/phosphatidylglycerophosphate/cardiolipin synthase-like enzyme
VTGSWPAHAALIDDPHEVTDVYMRLIDELGIKQARRRLELRFNVDRVPTRSELQEAIQRSGLSIVRIHDQKPAQ